MVTEMLLKAMVVLALVYAIWRRRRASHGDAVQ